LSFTEKTWKTFKDYIDKWKSLDGLERLVAEKCSELTEISVPGPELVYHMRCYRKFTDLQKVLGAEKRMQTQSQSQPHQGADEEQSNNVDIAPRNKILRSSKRSTDLCAVRRNRNVLPEQCIICNKDQYLTDTRTKKRQKEKLSNCELQSGKQSI